jgi:hypothetical protein
MNAASQVPQAISAVERPKPILHFAAYLLSGPLHALPPDLTAGFDGLVLAHLVQTKDGSTQVFTYWSSTEHFEIARMVVSQRLQAQLLPGSGLVSSVSVPAKPWWKKINPLTVVLSIAAAIGALDAIATRYDWLLAEPFLLVRPEKSKVDIVEVSDVRLNVALINQLPRTEHHNIKVTAELLNKDKKPYPLRPLEGDVAALAGGAIKDLAIEGTAPPSGEYVLRVTASGEAGWWRAAKAFHSEASFRVWPRTPRGSIRLVEAKFNWAHFVGVVEVGLAAKQGLDCELQIEGVPGLRFENQFHTSAGHQQLRWRTAGHLGNSVSMLSWSTGPVEAMRGVTTELFLLGEPTTNWQAVSGKMKMDCSGREENLNGSKS